MYASPRRVYVQVLTEVTQVPEKENQMRWEVAKVLALHKLQDGMCIHTGRKEAESAQRVGRQ